jgi:hypothetical protein
MACRLHSIERQRDDTASHRAGGRGMLLVTKKPLGQRLDQESSHEVEQIEDLLAQEDRLTDLNDSSDEYEVFVHRSELEEQILLAAGQTC